MQGTPEATPAPSRIVLAHSSGSKSHGVWKGLEGEPMTVHLREGDARGRGTRGHAQSTQRARAEHAEGTRRVMDGRERAGDAGRRGAVCGSVRGSAR